MRRYHHSKSGLFLMELLFNLLLFCVLCGFGLMFFIKSHNLSNKTTALQHAVRITSSIANVYEAGDGTFSSICAEFSNADIEEDALYIYLNEDYQPCEKSDSFCFVEVNHLDSYPNNLSIDFYDNKGELIYSIHACNYTPKTDISVKEVATPW